MSRACFTCLGRNAISDELVDMNKLDLDGITYMEKLKKCVRGQLVCLRKYNAFTFALIVVVAVWGRESDLFGVCGAAADRVQFQRNCFVVAEGA